MIAISAVAFYSAVVLYVLAAGIAVRYLWADEDRTLTAASRVTWVATVLIAITFACRWAKWHLVPLTTMFDSLCVFIMLSSLVVFFVLRDKNMRTLLCFYLPPLAGIALVAASTAHSYLAAEPRQLRETFLIIHVGLALLAYALFLVASVTSAGYLFQSRNLKNHQTTGLFTKLPSLAQLDTMLYRLISFGYPLFAITLVLGVIWAYVDRQLLGPYWFLSPKVLLSFVMMVFYSISFHTRRFGLLRGPKLAALVLCGFSTLLGVYLILGLMRLNTYHFWEVS